MRTLAVVVAVVLVAAAAAAEPDPTPTPAPATAKRLLSLDLDRNFDVGKEQGRAEFNLSLRRTMLDDPMVRLAFAVGQEEAAARRGGMFGLGTPFTAGEMFVNMPGADPRLVLKGPWAEDWHDLTPQEKIGRITETAVYYGVLFEILRALHR